jgi:hypothetical protein
MMTRIHGFPLIAVGLIACASVSVSDAGDKPSGNESPSVIGRWDVTVEGAEGKYPSWFEVRKSGYRTLVGSYVGQFGSARPISQVESNDGSLRFAVPPQWENRRTAVGFEGRLDGDVLRGETTDDDGKRIRWTARRAPTLGREDQNHWGEPVELFNGRDLSGWKPRTAGRKNGWKVREGVLINAEPGNDLLTDRKFTDFRVHAEFRYPQGSNSGIYLRGHYEVQIEDNFGQEPDNEKIGGVYGFLTPRINAAKPAGQWQSLEITLIGRRVTVEFNGERIIDRQIIPGITGGALDSDEGAPGPILIQGDHGPVEFRKLTLTPVAVSSQSSTPLP